MSYITVLLSGLALLGPAGMIVLLFLAGRVTWSFRDCPSGSFRWHMRTLHLKQIAAIASLFCLAMAASYALLGEMWSILYLLFALKASTFWLRLVLCPL
ncbi:hypothetical protein [Ktedonospora formicarum]|uniref:Uncharacterized protein n=1 Tax=Ktedonospora formicarum TaxID=2778364 RepID=A0A8J3ICB7_9CHLR|nr:hypothetical protein [Ktedonospora formicarum]GHO50032.1 hypothetical protein KSX_81950 [Ktedonospora formicarum]